ncbi:YchJ family protein [Wenyingzhuangia sp. 2_MG-2023]|uniref:YchJ family protein n=1 Tax=Wenyingzhuangia sp. 2_MG-2023 TaxID=3062639 RepID=UPI0026E13DF8|nr:YchJ family metal-binding protein [Wenyingzhuangia sp. 2_MG-2023]MDO6737511.1 YchJ family metal-binding protein [Wenyingzhuangia sp. 2_MG-2023]MDO6802814.1 YchJ family metal-binding protein [Wenyingzhuangia sp. 1_MG-2023]
MSKFSKLIQKQKEVKDSKKHRFNLEAKTNANREGVLCACGSKHSYKTCCEPIHKNIYLAETPLSLMRSRYTAYVLGNIEYLMLSHHSSTRPIVEKKEIETWAKSVQWLKLEIVQTSETTSEVGFVTFKAYFLENGKEHVIHEESRFVKENNHWSYIDGNHS